MGAACIHPSQVPVVNEHYRPGEDEVSWANAVVDGYEVAKAEGRASFALNGAMIDIPVVERAERYFARHSAVMEEKHERRAFKQTDNFRVARKTCFVKAENKRAALPQTIRERPQDGINLDSPKSQIFDDARGTRGYSSGNRRALHRRCREIWRLRQRNRHRFAQNRA